MALEVIPSVLVWRLVILSGRGVKRRKVGQGRPLLRRAFVLPFVFSHPEAVPDPGLIDAQIRVGLVTAIQETGIRALLYHTGGKVIRRMRTGGRKRRIASMEGRQMVQGDPCGREKGHMADAMIEQRFPGGCPTVVTDFTVIDPHPILRGPGQKKPGVEPARHDDRQAELPGDRLGSTRAVG